MEKRLFHVQPVEIHVGLGPVGEHKKFSTVDVTKYLEELHGEVVKMGLSPLSFTVVSAYEAHWEKDKAQTDNVAILQAGWLVGPDTEHPSQELDFYCGKLLEKFGQNMVVMKVLEIIQVVGYSK